jgi:hypothetical protein
MGRRSTTDELSLALLGAAVGAAAGFLLGVWLGPVDSRRASRAVRSLARTRQGGSAAQTAAIARGVLAGTPELAALELTVLPVTPTAIELHGWVDSRAHRARAARALMGVAPLETVINCVLVRGEDDGEAVRSVRAHRPA